MGTACGSGACAGVQDANAGACDFTATQGASCEDGDLCTTGELCAGGTCVGGAPTSCNDGNTCTVDSCVSPAGCQHAPLTGDACDDANLCTTGEACQAGACTGGTVAIVCDDGDACTSDFCVAATGQCDASYLNTGANAPSSQRK